MDFNKEKYHLNVELLNEKNTYINHFNNKIAFQ